MAVIPTRGTKRKPDEDDEALMPKVDHKGMIITQTTPRKVAKKTGVRVSGPLAKKGIECKQFIMDYLREHMDESISIWAGIQQGLHLVKTRERFARFKKRVRKFCQIPYSTILPSLKEAFADEAVTSRLKLLKKAGRSRETVKVWCYLLGMAPTMSIPPGACPFLTLMWARTRYQKYASRVEELSQLLKSEEFGASKEIDWCEIGPWKLIRSATAEGEQGEGEGEVKRFDILRHTPSMIEASLVDFDADVTVTDKFQVWENYDFGGVISKHPNSAGICPAVVFKDHADPAVNMEAAQTLFFQEYYLLEKEHQQLNEGEKEDLFELESPIKDEKESVTASSPACAEKKVASARRVRDASMVRSPAFLSRLKDDDKVDEDDDDKAADVEPEK